MTPSTYRQRLVRHLVGNWIPMSVQAIRLLDRYMEARQQVSWEDLQQMEQTADWDTLDGQHIPYRRAKGELCIKLSRQEGLTTLSLIQRAISLRNQLTDSAICRMAWPT